jgi:hypothetical protein
MHRAFGDQEHRLLRGVVKRFDAVDQSNPILSLPFIAR